MTTIHTITAPEAATVTEQELWAIFVRHAVKTTFSMGPVIDTFRPDDCLRDPGVYGITDGFTDEVADDLAEHDEPSARLLFVIEELSDYVERLRQVSDAFLQIKESLAVYSEDDSEECEPRFRAPMIEESEAA